MCSKKEQKTFLYQWLTLTTNITLANCDYTFLVSWICELTKPPCMFIHKILRQRARTKLLLTYYIDNHKESPQKNSVLSYDNAFTGNKNCLLFSYVRRTFNHIQARYPVPDYLMVLLVEFFSQLKWHDIYLRKSTILNSTQNL